MAGNLSYGEMLLYSGIILCAVSVIALIVGTVIFASRRRLLRKEMIDEYGF